MTGKSHGDAKHEALRKEGTLNPRPRAVTNPLFEESDFFDPHDLVQVKYEMLRQASEALAQGEYDKTSALIAQVKAEASRMGLAATFCDRTAELTSIVAQARAEVKMREAAKKEKAARKAFGQWMKGKVLPNADFARGDVVVTLGIGHAMFLRPRITRRDHSLRQHSPRQLSASHPCHAPGHEPATERT